MEDLVQMGVLDQVQANIDYLKKKWEDISDDMDTACTITDEAGDYTDIFFRSIGRE